MEGRQREMNLGWLIFCASLLYYLFILCVFVVLSGVWQWFEGEEDGVEMIGFGELLSVFL